MGNIKTQASILRNEITAALQASHLNEKYTHNRQRDRLERLFSDLEDKHNLGAHKMTIALVGSWIGILAAPFGDKTAGKILSGASGFLTKTNDFMQELDKGDKTKIEGLKQLLQQEIQDETKTDDAILNRLREIDRMVDEALGKMNDATTRAFR